MWGVGVSPVKEIGQNCGHSFVTLKIISVHVLACSLPAETAQNK